MPAAAVSRAEMACVRSKSSGSHAHAWASGMENGAEPVDGVVAENQRNTEPALFDGDVLQAVSLRGSFDQFAAAEE